MADRRFRRALWRGLAVLFGVMLVAPPLLWLTLPAWLPDVAKRVAGTRGLGLVELQVERPGVAAWSVPLLRLTIPAAIGDHQLEVVEAQLHYSLRQLWRGELDSVSAEHLAVALAPLDSAEPAASAPVAVAALLPSAWWSRVPVHSVTVRRWSASGLPELGGWLPYALTGRLLKGADAIQLDARAGQDRLQLQISASDAASLVVEFRGAAGRVQSGWTDGALALTASAAVPPSAGLWETLPLATLGIAEPELRTEFSGTVVLPERLSSATGPADFAASGTGNLSFQAAGAMSPEVAIPYALRFEAGRQQLEFGSGAALHATVAGSLLFPTVKPLHSPARLSLTVPQAAGFVFAAEAMRLRQTGGTLDFRFEQAGAGVSAGVQVHNALLEPNGFSAQWESSGRFAGLAAAGWPALSWRLHGGGEAQGNDWAVSVAAGGAVDLPAQTLSAIVLQPARIVLEDAGRLFGAGTTVGSGPFRLATGRLGASGAFGVLNAESLRVSGAGLRCDAGGCRGRQSVEVSGLAVVRERIRLPALDLAVDVTAAADEMRIDGLVIMPPTDNHLRLTGAAAPSLQRGEVRFDLSLDDLKPWRTALVQLLDDRSLSITSGELTAQGDLRWTAGNAVANGVVQLDGFGGTVYGTTLTGLEMAAPISMHDGVWRAAPRLSLVSADAGLPVTDLTLGATLWGTEQQIRGVGLDEFHATVLGGTLSATPFRLDDTLSGAGALQVNGLDLAALIETFDYQGLAMTGRLDGRLPFRLQEMQLFVDDGRVANRQPGTIRLKPSPALAAGAARNSQLQVLLGALQDFRYSRLESAIGYDPGGKATLMTLIEGANPSWNQGHSVRLSVNIEEDVHALFKSLRTSRILTERIEQGVEQSVGKR